jgi:hypothetical protein
LLKLNKGGYIMIKKLILSILVTAVSASASNRCDSVDLSYPMPVCVVNNSTCETLACYRREAIRAKNSTKWLVYFVGEKTFWSDSSYFYEQSIAGGSLGNIPVALVGVFGYEPDLKMVEKLLSGRMDDEFKEERHIAIRRVFHTCGLDAVCKKAAYQAKRYVGHPMTSKSWYWFTSVIGF